MAGGANASQAQRGMDASCSQELQGQRLLVMLSETCRESILEVAEHQQSPSWMCGIEQ